MPFGNSKLKDFLFKVSCQNRICSWLHSKVVPVFGFVSQIQTVSGNVMREILLHMALIHKEREIDHFEII